MVYMMLLPVMIYYVIFHYLPMLGVVIAFQNFKPAKGLTGSKWVGFKHFIDFFDGPYAWRLIRNTLLLSLYQILIGFPAPILLALLFNEMRGKRYKRVCQTLTYVPHFVSLVVVCGLIRTFTSSTGLITSLFVRFGMEKMNLLAQPQYYRTIYVLSGVWQNIGWGSIIYLATLSNVDPSLFEAADLDGANRLQKILHINLPMLIPIIAVQLIMRVGRIMSEGSEKTILLYSAVTYDTSDIISSYVYRTGLEKRSYSPAAAIGLFNSLINMGLVVFANWFSRTYVNESLW
ncbi:MAG: ABC transporter permease subunit [Clostridiales bacterium]|nr:ABC transporter permease subunit [Clostridiales bacterium]